MIDWSMQELTCIRILEVNGMAAGSEESPKDLAAAA